MFDLKNIVTSLVVSILVFAGGYVALEGHKAVSVGAGSWTQSDLGAKGNIIAGPIGTPNDAGSGVVGTIYATSGLFEGGINSTTTPASMTLALSDLNSSSLLSMTPTVGSITVTLPASTTMSSGGFLPNAGDCTWDVIHNATTTASSNITLAAGTGFILADASTTKAIIPGGAASLRICRKANTDYIGVMVPAI